MMSAGSWIADSLEARASRKVMVCVPSDDKEADATWTWAMSRFLDPESDAVTFLHVHRGGLVPLPPNERDSAEPFASWLPDTVAAQVKSFTIDAHFVEASCNLFTSPGDALLHRLATLQPADQPTIILTGSRGVTSTPVMRWFITSVSQTLVEHGAYAVLVVRPEAQRSARTMGLPVPVSTPRVVALALDPSADTARAQLRWACKYVLRNTDEVKLLMGPGTWADLKTQHSSAAMAHAAVILEAAKATLEPLLSAAAASPECVALADNVDVRDGIQDWLEKHQPVDLLIIGRRSVRKKPLKRAHMGSVSTYVLRHAWCAVLVVNESTLHEGLM